MGLHEAEETAGERACKGHAHDPRYERYPAGKQIDGSAREQTPVGHVEAGKGCKQDYPAGKPRGQQG